MTPRLDLKPAPATLNTPRLWLDTPQPAHAAAFAEGLRASLPALAYIAWRQPYDTDWAARFCADDARCVAEGRDLVYHAFERADGGWVGRIDVHTIHFDDCRGEIGYVGDVRRAGRGLMREAVLAVIDLCFRLGFQRLEALSDARNARALAFAEALGMAHEGVLRRHERDPQGRLCDMVVYAALNPRPEAEA